MRIAGMLFLLAAAAAAQETGKQDPPAPSSKADDVTIFGTSPVKGQELFDAPYAADVVSSDDIVHRRMSRTLPEALEEAPGVSVQKTGPGQASPYIRGFPGFRNVMLIDGIRLNNSVFRDGPNQYWSTVDSYLVDRMELIRGPASVLHGSDSIGGTLLAFTTEPGTGGAGPGSRSIARHATAERSVMARQEFSMSGDGAGAMVGGTVRQYGNLEGGTEYGKMAGTGYEQWSADAKAVFGVGKKGRIVVAAQHDRTLGAPRWHRQVESLPWKGTPAGTELVHNFDQDRQLYYAQYHGEFENAAVDAVSASLSLHRQAEDEERHRNPANLQANFRDHTVQTPGAFVRAGKRTEAGYFTAGAEVYADSVRSAGSDRSAGGVVTVLPRGNVAADALYVLWGIYLQDELTLGPVDLTGGVRFSMASVDATGVDPAIGGGPTPDTLKDDYHAVTGSLRAVYHLTDQVNLIGGWGMGFRAPSLDDTTTFAAVAGGGTDIGGPGLRPETSHSLELGVRGDFQHFGMSAFGFATFLRDYIIRVPIGDVVPAGGDGFVDFAKANGADGWVTGWELAGFVRPMEGVTVFADWSYARGVVDQVDGAGASLGKLPLSKMGPMLSHVGVRWELPKRAVWVELVLTIADSQTHLSFADASDPRIPPGGTPGYTTLSLRGGVQVTEQFRIMLAVENLYDMDYRIHGSGQNEPGIGGVISGELRL
jgi:hemoglobin/transferrin/lactoferrin receptor protein